MTSEGVEGKTQGAICPEQSLPWLVAFWGSREQVGFESGCTPARRNFALCSVCPLQMQADACKQQPLSRDQIYRIARLRARLPTCLP